MRQKERILYTLKNFRSFLNNDNTVKILCIFLAVLLILAAVFAGVKIANNKANIFEPESNASENDVGNESTADFYHFGSPLDLDVAFEPFECKGYFYSFEKQKIKNQDGMLFSETKTDEYIGGNHNNAIAYNFNGQEKILFETHISNASLSIAAYVDDSLYFSDDNCLYRIYLEYDEAGDIINSNISLVIKDYYLPVKADDNALILSDINGNAYLSLNTLNGQAEAIDYNEKITDESNVKVSLISEEEAVKLAGEEIKNQKYFRDMTSDREEDVILFPDERYKSELIYNPDIIRETYEEYKYELYPEYIWKVYFTGEFSGKVYVNARTGKISYVSVDFLD